MAVVPLVLVLTLALGQLVCVGWAVLEAGAAARAAARARHVGADAEATALESLPAALRPADVAAAGAEVSVRVRAPALLPGAPAIPVEAAAALDPAAGTP